MSEEHTTQRRRVLAFVGLTVVVLAAIAVRASVQFGTRLMPGMNRAYYLSRCAPLSKRVTWPNTTCR
jgi:hypothetical protein